MWHVLFCHKYTSYIQVFHYFLDLKKQLIRLMFKLIKYTLKKQKKSKMWCPSIQKKSNCKNIILMTTIFGGFSVLMPKNAS
jgi:hypothetical protein